jgi:hypothetical protein
VEIKSTRRKGKKRALKKAYSSDESEGYSEEDSDIGVDYEFKIPTNTWILKPGENTNRGNGIVVCKTLKEIKALVSNSQ